LVSGCLQILFSKSSTSKYNYIAFESQTLGLSLRLHLEPHSLGLSLSLGPQNLGLEPYLELTSWSWS